MSDTPETPSSPRPSAQTVARLILATLLVIGVLVVAWVAVDLLSVRSSLQDARSALGDVRGSLGAIDVDAADEALEVAEDELADARRRSGRWTWSVAAAVPIAGPSVEVTREVVEVASASVDIARIGVDEGRQLLDDGLEVAVVDGRIDLNPLVTARELLASMPIDRLVEARDRLAAPRSAWLPAELREGRADTLELADETVQLLLTAEGLTEAMPSFLGSDGPRRYFLGFQTSGELRATGGLIGYWGVLAVDDGQVVFGQSEVYDPAASLSAPDRDGGDGDADEDGSADEDGAAGDDGGDGEEGRVGVGNLSAVNPPDADEDYLARYQLFQGARYMSNINLDPDLPTTSKAILDLFELQSGQQLDGVVLLDPPGLQRMLQATGSTLPLSDELAEEIGYPEGLPTDRFTSFVTAEIYGFYGVDRTPERRAALQEIGDAAFRQVFGGGWDSAQMLRAFADGARQRNLQVFAADADIQAAFQQAGATGELDLPEDADQLTVTANNAVGGKQDVHLGHEFRFDLQLSEPGRTDDGTLVARRDGELEITVDNPLPASGMDPYVIGNCIVPGARNECFEGPSGQNRTWFSLWTGPDTFVIDFESDDDSAPWGYDNTFRGLRVVDYYLETPPEDRASLRYELTGIVPLREVADGVVYELAWWRQAKAIPDLLDVQVRSPDGWAISEVVLVGGGDGRGSGVHGNGQELVAELRDGVATLTGTVTADTRLQLRLVGDD